ncbi:hypothetical protein B0T26DRAFT_243948 [Lasiosphaeria miniovina]|uniref:Uncharacterized protein n=1 Tax=Lasiosphaeria miniovina TaxID=1954250 RepID=A0AA40AVT9_9PEZI|nr:uncharacterized protein B0T26DRAFT_243948 [Lasiosphaeria miniovina]KAK0722972.1 hypothetical protein B0T26DRAFT_243948 [Lasiosphaeria miniovina]
MQRQLQLPGDGCWPSPRRAGVGWGSVRPPLVVYCLGMYSTVGYRRGEAPHEAAPKVEVGKVVPGSFQQLSLYRPSPGLVWSGLVFIERVPFSLELGHVLGIVNGTDCPPLGCARKRLPKRLPSRFPLIGTPGIRKRRLLPGPVEVCRAAISLFQRPGRAPCLGRPVRLLKSNGERRLTQGSGSILVAQALLRSCPRHCPPRPVENGTTTCRSRTLRP